MMHGREKSDSAIVAGKPTNNAGQPAAEPVEPRAEAKGNASQQSTRRTQSRVSVSHALERIRQNRNEKRFAVTHPRWEKLWGGATEIVAPSSSIRTAGGCPEVPVNDLSRSLAAFGPTATVVAVVEMSKMSWRATGVGPGVARQPR